MIQIVRGVYGYLDKDGIVRPKTEADGPFALNPEQEARLVALGVAQYVKNVKLEQEPEETASEDTEQAEDEGETYPIGIDDVPPVEIDLSTLSVKELREIGKEYGLVFKVGTSKAEMIKEIEDAEAALVIDAEDDEPAPVFDASEAVQ